MKNIDIIFTVDYEVHGNGQGNFVDYAYEPTERMLNIANEYGAKITLMAEMEHYFAMKSHLDFFKNDINLFETQISRAIKESHDVQLHLHPQWLNAKLEEDRWIFPYTAKEIALLCNDYELANSRVKQSKNWLEEFLKPFDNNYECNSFRAGYFQIQPSHNISRALINNGIFCDSSVFKGGYRKNDDIGKLDFREVSSSYYPYRASLKDVSVTDIKSPLLEIPLFSYKYSPILDRIKRNLFGIDKNADIISELNKRRLSRGDKTALKKKGFKLELIKRGFFSRYKYLDIFLSEPDFIVDKIKEKARYVDKDTAFLFLTHSKTFTNQDRFIKLLEKINDLQYCNYITLREAALKYHKITNSPI